MSRSTVVVFLCVVYCAAVMGRLDLFTEDKVKYKFFPYSNTSIHFKVKAANDAHIGLTTGPHETDPMIEVVIGGWQNTNSVIRRRFRTLPDKVSTETPGILSNGKFRSFWVSWKGGVIAVGREGTNTPFMSWNDTNPFHVSYVGVHTGFGSTGSWKIEDPPSDSDTGPPASSPANDDIETQSMPEELYTENNVEYKFFPYSNTSIHFKVKAGNDVHIGLTTGPQESDPMIEIAIGGWSNTNSVIRRRFRTIPEKYSAETPGVVSGGEYRGFRVSWEGGVIAVTSDGEDAPFMFWKDPNPFKVTYVGVHTGFGSVGSWKFGESPSESSEVDIKPQFIPKEVYTENNVEYKFFPYLNTSIHFKVKAGNDVHIGLTTGPQESDPMIEIAIGGWSNTNSVIRRRFRTIPEKVSAETPGIVSGGELRGFWVSWDGGVIEVGREGEDAPFMSWKDPEPFKVKYIGMHTGFGSSGSWIIEGLSSTTGRVY